MRDIILYTKNAMVYEDCATVILANVKGAITNTKNYFHSNDKYFWSLEIDNEDLETSLKGFDEEYIKERKQWQCNNIPIENPVMNLLQIHRSVDAKRIIEELMKIYPELYVEVDDAETWLGSAQEYLDKEFDF